MEIERLLRLMRIEPGLEFVAGGSGLRRRVHSPFAVHAGLGPAGSGVPPAPGRILLLGRAGCGYLSAAAPTVRQHAADRLLEGEPPAVIVTDGGAPPAELTAAADARGVPLFATGATPAAVAAALRSALGGLVDPVTSTHGVLVDVYGVGVLITGRSGLGKSEAGLELVLRGHRLVADDVVDLALHAPAMVIGSGNEVLRHSLEIRGLGIVDVRDLFGIASVRETKRVELVVRLEEWRSGRTYERLGLSENTCDLLGVALPMVVIPVGPGRSLSTIIEVAARVQLARWIGHDAARAVDGRLRAGAAIAGAAGEGEEDLE
jgi:HPr kinase/phosphorylase